MARASSDEDLTEAVTGSLTRAAPSRSSTSSEPGAWTTSSTSNEGRPVASARACSIMAWKRPAACSRTMELGAVTTPLEPETSARTNEANHALYVGSGTCPRRIVAARRPESPGGRSSSAHGHKPHLTHNPVATCGDRNQALGDRRYQRLPTVRGEGAGLSDWVFMCCSAATTGSL